MKGGWAALIAGVGVFLTGAAALASARGRQGEGVILGEGFEYTPTDVEWLWLARSCFGETGDYEGRVAVAWCIIQRFVAFDQRGGPFDTFESLIRAFSQPVNPIWSRLDACTADGRGCCGDTTRCSTRRLEQRDYIQSRSWAWFQENEPELYALIRSFQSGNPPANPIPGYTNFAACSSVSGLNIGDNCFLTDSPPLEGVVTVR